MNSDRSNAVSLIVPCAGKGSRLGLSHLPKALAPIGEGTILSHILDKIGGMFDDIVLVVSNSHVKQFETFIEGFENNRIRLAVQDSPVGSLNAVNVGMQNVQGNCIVVWGDQIGVSESTIRKMIDLHLDNPSVDFAVPVIYTAEPYVWLELDAQHQTLIGVGRRRDGDHIDIGWADLGAFFFSNKIFQTLSEVETIVRDSNEGKEVDLIYALPILTESFLGKFLERFDSNELLAINTAEELEKAARFLNA